MLSKLSAFSLIYMAFSAVMPILDINYLRMKMRERSLSSSAQELVRQWKHRRLITVDEETGLITRIIA